MIEPSEFTARELIWELRRTRQQAISKGIRASIRSNKTTNMKKAWYNPKDQHLYVQGNSRVDMRSRPFCRALCHLVFIDTPITKRKLLMEYKNILADHHSLLENYGFSPIDETRIRQLKRAKNQINTLLTTKDLFDPGKNLKVNPKYF